MEQDTPLIIVGSPHKQECHGLDVFQSVRTEYDGLLDWQAFTSAFLSGAEDAREQADFAQMAKDLLLEGT